MKPINIGKLNKKITFLKYEEIEDCMGQLVPDWKPHKTVWATVKALRGGEYWEAQKIRPELTYKVTTRYQPEITPDMRILYQGKTMEIKTVVNIEEANHILEMQCTDYIEKNESSTERERKDNGEW